jgi:hypothetical protein
MSRISIDVSPQEHKKLKALAALQGKSIKDFVIERTLGMNGEDNSKGALAELELLLDERIRAARKGATSKRTVASIFEAAYKKAAR